MLLVPFERATGDGPAYVSARPRGTCFRPLPASARATGLPSSTCVYRRLMATDGNVRGARPNSGESYVRE